MKTTLIAAALGLAACTSAYAYPANDWFAMTAPMFGMIVEPMQEVSRTCQALDLVGCKRATRVVAIQSTGVLRMLEANPAPACLANVEQQVKQGFRLLRDGTELMARQIDTMNVDSRPVELVEQGVKIIASLTANLRQLAAGCQL